MENLSVIGSDATFSENLEIQGLLICDTGITTPSFVGLEIHSGANSTIDFYPGRNVNFYADATIQGSHGLSVGGALQSSGNIISVSGTVYAQHDVQAQSGSVYAYGDMSCANSARATTFYAAGQQGDTTVVVISGHTLTFTGGILTIAV